MWQPTKLRVNSFLSYVSADIDFKLSSNTPVVIALYGENRVSGGADSNGSGKSSIIDAILFALTGATSRNVTNNDLIREGSENSEVSITLINNSINSRIDIKRNLARGKSAKVSILHDNSVVSVVDTNEANKWILERLGIEKTDLLNYFVVNSNSDETFFKLGDASKKRLINRFINLDMLNVLSKQIAAELAVLNKKVVQNTFVISNKEHEIKNYQNQCEIAMIKIKNEHQIKINSAEFALKSNKEVVSKIEYSINEISTQLETINKELSKGTSTSVRSEYQLIKKQNSDIQSSIVKSNSDMNDMLKQLKELTALCDSQGIPCADCLKGNYVFRGISYERDIVLSMKNVALDSYNSFTNSIMTLNVELNSGIEKLNLLDKKIAEIGRTETTKAVLTQNLERLSKQLIESKAAVIEQEAARDNLLNSEPEVTLYESELKNAKAALEQYSTELIALNSGLENQVKESEQLNYWTIKLGKDGFEAYITAKCLSYIENAINKNLFLFDKELSIRVNSTKVTSTDELRNKIDITVIQNGIETPYSALSHGEQVRLDICGILAIQQLLNVNAANKIEGGGFCFLVLDELFEGLDSKGQDNVVKLLKMSKQLVIYITHQQSECNLADKWVVIKDFNGSRVEVV